ncbi:Uncharacterised protein [Mycobacteroides abscessus subsp. abscessus]|nr:Uncharacterised protein [Mycobacteroides abscessus subsp. abscessus]
MARSPPTREANDADHSDARSSPPRSGLTMTTTCGWLRSKAKRRAYI